MLEGHTKPVGIITWHPQPKICFSAQVLTLWNVSTAEELYCLDSLHPDLLYNVSSTTMAASFVQLARTRASKSLVPSGAQWRENGRKRVRGPGPCRPSFLLITRYSPLLSAAQVNSNWPSRTQKTLRSPQPCKSWIQAMVLYCPSMTQTSVCGKGDSSI